ncbi:type II toxin-antitoxin system VapC family toxin [Nostoc sp. C052]|uniref:type II toxin-antitoxin system VapC family toxin n=1 Tax=Nostoc sp. C052 TaxID=2576902 RepID=UPI0015C30572|nr:type II toxin-antitoxin system VapC family toxin [Nostoc sp. C052]QLE42958.1 type II toxin-antitoxin system VapC family toxin [Nostoc sp. C052]
MGMSYLIDTHILLWWLFDDPKLHTDCRDIIRNPDYRIIVSSASAWEIATKYRMGKLPEAKQLVEQYSQILHQAKFIELAITTDHALRAGSLPIAHRDPFDRMIMAQAEIESLVVITYDKAFHTGLIQVIPDLK